MSIKIETAVFCRNGDCCASGMIYNQSWAIGWRCPFCSQKVARVRDHIRIPTARAWWSGRRLSRPTGRTGRRDWR